MVAPSTSASIRLTVDDQASAKFQAIGKSATGLQTQLTSAGKALELIGQAAKGAQTAALIAFLSDAARASNEAAVIMDRLRTTIDNTGQAFDLFAPAIDKALGSAEKLAYDGEYAAEALNTLVSFTGDTTEAMDLLATSMDIARGRGLDLQTVAVAVGKAAQGSTSSLEKLGIAASEGADAQQALAEAQAKYAGQAEAYAATQQATTDRLRIAWGNVQETIGGLTDGLAGVIALAPGLSSTFALLGSTISVLKNAKDLVGLSSFINPVAIGLAGLATAVGVVVTAFRHYQAEARLSEQASKDFATALGDIEDIALRADIDGLTISVEEFGEAAGKNIAVWNLFDEEVRKVAFADSAQATRDWSDAIGTATDTIQAADGDLRAFSDTASMIKDMLLETGLGFDAGTDAILDYAKAASYTGPAQEEVAAGLEQIRQGMRDGKYDVYSLADALAMLVADMPRFEANAARQSAATIALLRNFGALKSGIVGTRAEYEAYIRATMEVYNAQLSQMSAEERVAAIRERVNTGIVGNVAAFERYVTAANNAAAANDEQGKRALELQGIFESALYPAIQGLAGAMTELAIPGEDIIDLLSRIGLAAPNVSDAFADLVNNLKDSAGALDQMLGVFSAIDNLGTRSESAVDVATKIVGDPDTIGIATDLLNKNLISLEQKQQLDEESARITAANASVQEDLNLMRVAQLDNLADAEMAYAAYIDQLSRASEEEQRNALYLMDSANQAKVAAAYSTAYSASLGEIPEEVGTDIITNAAMADPVLKDILLSYGLIEEGANGEITVNLPDASEQAMMKFTSMFGQGNVAMTADGLVVVKDAEGNSRVYDQFGNLVDKSVTATINVTLSHDSGLDSDTIAGVLAGRGMTPEQANVTTSTVAVIVEADVTEFEKSLADAQAAGQEFADNGFTTTIGGNPEGFNDTMVDATDLGADWSNTEFITGIGGDREPWNVVLAEATGMGTDFQNTTYTTNLDGNKKFFDEVVASVSEKVVGTAYIEIDAVDQNGDVPRSAMQLGGTVHGSAVSSIGSLIPAARNGRTILVGEAGPELAFLPSGTQVMPSTPSRSRMAADTASGGIRFYGPVTIQATTPDIAREIERQFATRAMR